jgi:hypothetical protein
MDLVKKGTTEEYLKELESQNQYPWSIYEFLSKRISILLQYADIIDKHPDELEDSLKLKKEKYNFKPSVLLLECIVNDIQAFYRLAIKNMDEIGITENDFPEYQKEKLRRFRDRITGHLEDITIKENIDLYRMINNISFERIFSDYLNFRDMIIKKLKEKTKAK